tara:strand:- start:425 stop:607 length:183 start_codon:yes stop_codon:yes gene_type:complete
MGHTNQHYGEVKGSGWQGYVKSLAHALTSPLFHKRGNPSWVARLVQEKQVAAFFPIWHDQ